MLSHFGCQNPTPPPHVPIPSQSVFSPIVSANIERRKQLTNYKDILRLKNELAFPCFRELALSRPPATALLRFCESALLRYCSIAPLRLCSSPLPRSSPPPRYRVPAPLCVCAIANVRKTGIHPLTLLDHLFYNIGIVLFWWVYLNLWVFL